MQRFTDQIFAHLRTITVGRINKIDAKFGQPAQSKVERNRSGGCVLRAWTNYEKDADMTQAETALTHQFVAEVCLVGMGLDVLGGVTSLKVKYSVNGILSLEFGHFLGCHRAIICGGEFLQAAALSTRSKAVA
jgi:hypothetical protein